VLNKFGPSGHGEAQVAVSSMAIFPRDRAGKPMCDAPITDGQKSRSTN